MYFLFGTIDAHTRIRSLTKTSNDKTKMGPYVEVIRIRSGNRQSDGLESQIREIVEKALETSNINTIRFYTSQLITGDYMISLFWSEPILEKQGSLIGQRLKTDLEEIGLIDHSMWIQLELLK
jgi:hypothetical protein